MLRFYRRAIRSDSHAALVTWSPHTDDQWHMLRIEAEFAF